MTNDILNNGHIGNIHYGDIHATYKSSFIDVQKTKIPLIKDEDFVPKDKDLLKNGDLVMADASEDYEGIGTTVSIHGINDNKVVGGLHTFVLRDNKNKTNEYYRQYIFSNPDIKDKLRKIATGVSVFGISKTNLSKVKLPLPSLLEQNAIVEVLETWDKYLEDLTNKIKLKKRVKKGLMQKLLSGDKRLKGFSSEWKKVKLGDVCERIRTGKIDANAMVKNGKYRFYTCAKEYFKIDDYAFDTEALLVSGNGANVGYIHYYKGKFNAYQRTYVLDNFKSDIIFTKYILDKNLRKRIYEEKCDGNTPYIKMNTLTDMIIEIPELKEQQAIAEVLTKADEEIEGLEKKKKIVEKQKKYLLNNLITGKIRLPEFSK